MKGLSRTAWAVIAVVIIVVIVAAAAALTYKPPVKTTTTPTTTTSTTTTLPPTSTTPTTTTTSTPTTTTTTTAPSSASFCASVSGPVTITVWDTYSPSENEAFNASLAQFEAEYPCIKVEVTTGVQVSTGNFEAAAKAGKAPIIYRDTSNDAGALFAGGLLLNLSKYIPASLLAQYNPIAIRNFELNGSLYGLPDNINYIVMFYNKKYIPNPPNTTNQLIQMALQVNKTYGVWGIAYGMGSEYGYRFAAWLAGFGGHIFNGAGYPAVNATPAAAEAMEFWYNLTYDLHINAPDMNPTLEGNLFSQGKAAIIFDGPWDLATYVKALGPNLGAAPLPVVSQTGLYAEPFIGSTGWVISVPQASGATPEQIKAAILFIEFMSGPVQELNLWKYAGDIPSYLPVYNQVIANLTAGKLQPAYMNGIMNGILAQAQHGQVFPNIPQMNFYWNGFHQCVTLYTVNGTLTAPQAANCWEQYMVSQMQQAGMLG
ncbi:extracellular solute-binding protein [Thermocladium modestius]|uniref:extracellular solute-binding protein n=1 Tax=Thermocladium modestius TaxID=62609 RepID=UPI0016674C50|nr:extracellular solute-binding protein [Thermocladium modestius]